MIGDQLSARQEISIVESNKTLPSRKNDSAESLEFYGFNDGDGNETDTTNSRTRRSRFHETRSLGGQRSSFVLPISLWLSSAAAASNASAARTKRDNKSSENSFNFVSSDLSSSPRRSTRRFRVVSKVAAVLAPRMTDNKTASSGGLLDVESKALPDERLNAADELQQQDGSQSDNSIDERSAESRKQPAAFVIDSLKQKQESSTSSSNGSASLQLPAADPAIEDDKLMAEQSEQRMVTEEPGQAGEEVAQLDLLRRNANTSAVATLATDQQVPLYNAPLRVDRPDSQSQQGSIGGGSGADSPVSPVDDAHQLSEEAELVGAHNFIQFGQVGGSVEPAQQQQADNVSTSRGNAASEASPPKRNLNASLEAEAKLRDTMNQLHYNKTLAFERNAAAGLSKQQASAHQAQPPAAQLLSNASRLVPDESNLLPPMSVLDLEEDSARRAHLMPIGAERQSEVMVSPTRAPSKSVEYMNQSERPLSNADLLEAADEIHQRQHGAQRRKASSGPAAAQVGTDWGRRKNVGQSKQQHQSGLDGQTPAALPQQPQDVQNSNASYEDIITWTPTAGAAAYRAGSGNYQASSSDEQQSAMRPTRNDSEASSNPPISYYVSSSSDNQNSSDYSIDYRPSESEPRQQAASRKSVGFSAPSSSSPADDYLVNEARQSEVVSTQRDPSRGPSRVRQLAGQQQRRRRPQATKSESGRYETDGYSSASSAANPMSNSRHPSSSNQSEGDEGTQSDGDEQDDDNDNEDDEPSPQQTDAQSGQLASPSMKGVTQSRGQPPRRPLKSDSDSDSNETGGSADPEEGDSRDSYEAAPEGASKKQAGKARVNRYRSSSRLEQQSRGPSEDSYASGGDHASSSDNRFYNGTTLDAQWSPTAPPQAQRASEEAGMRYRQANYGRQSPSSRLNGSRDEADLIVGSKRKVEDSYEPAGRQSYPPKSGHHYETSVPGDHQIFTPLTKTFRVSDQRDPADNPTDRASSQLESQQQLGQRIVEPMRTAGSSSEDGRHHSQQAHFNPTGSTGVREQVVRGSTPSWRPHQYQGGFSPQPSPPFGHNYQQQQAASPQPTLPRQPYPASFVGPDFGRSQSKQFSPVLVESNRAHYEPDQSHGSLPQQAAIRPSFNPLDSESRSHLRQSVHSSGSLAAGYRQPGGNASWSIVTYPYPQAASNALSYFSYYHQNGLRPNQQMGGGPPVRPLPALSSGRPNFLTSEHYEFNNQPSPSEPTNNVHFSTSWSHNAEPSSHQSSRATMERPLVDGHQMQTNAQFHPATTKLHPSSMYNMPAPQLLTLDQDGQAGPGGEPTSSQRGVRNVQPPSPSGKASHEGPSPTTTTTGNDHYLTINLKTHAAVGPNQLFWEAAAREAAASAAAATTSSNNKIEPGKLPLSNGHHPPQHREPDNSLPMMRRPYAALRFAANGLSPQDAFQLGSQTTNGHAYAGQLKPQLAAAALMADLNEFAQLQQANDPHEYAYVGAPQTYIPISLASTNPLDDAEAMSFMGAAAAMPASAFVAPSIDLEGVQQGGGGGSSVRNPNTAGSSLAPTTPSMNDNQFLKKGTALISGHLPLASPSSVSDPFGWPMGYGSEAAKSLLKVNHVAPPPSYLVPAKVTAAQTSALLYPTMIDPKQGSSTPIKEDSSIISSPPALQAQYASDDQMGDFMHWSSSMLAQHSMLRPQFSWTPSDSSMGSDGGSQQLMQSDSSNVKPNYVKVALSTRRPATRRARLWERLRLLSQRATSRPGLSHPASGSQRSIQRGSTKRDRARVLAHKRYKRSIVGFVSGLMKSPRKFNAGSSGVPEQNKLGNLLPTRLAIVATGTGNNSEQELLSTGSSEATQAVIPLLNHNNIIDNLESDLLMQALLFNQKQQQQQQQQHMDVQPASDLMTSNLSASPSMRVVSHTPMSQPVPASSKPLSKEIGSSSIPANIQQQTSLQINQPEPPAELETDNMLYAPIYAPIEQEAVIGPPANEPGSHLELSKQPSSRERLKQLSKNWIKSSRKPLTRLMKLRTNLVNRSPANSSNNHVNQMETHSNMGSNSQIHMSIAQQLNSMVSPSVMMSHNVNSLDNFNRFAAPMQQWFQMKQHQQQATEHSGGQFEANSASVSHHMLLPLANHASQAMSPSPFALAPTPTSIKQHNHQQYQPQQQLIAPRPNRLVNQISDSSMMAATAMQQQQHQTPNNGLKLDKQANGNRSLARPADPRVSRHFSDFDTIFEDKQLRGVGAKSNSLINHLNLGANLMEFRPRLGSQAQRSDRLNPIERAMSDLQLYDRYQQFSATPLMRSKSHEDLAQQVQRSDQKQTPNNEVRRISDYDFRLASSQHNQEASNQPVDSNMPRLNQLESSSRSGSYPMSSSWPPSRSATQNLKLIPAVGQYRPVPQSGLRFVSQPNSDTPSHHQRGQIPRPDTPIPIGNGDSKPSHMRQFRQTTSDQAERATGHLALIGSPIQNNSTGATFFMPNASDQPQSLRYTHAEIYSSPSSQQPVELIGGLRTPGELEAAKLAAVAATAQSSAALLAASSLDDQTSFNQLLSHPTSTGSNAVGAANEADSGSFSSSIVSDSSKSPTDISNGDFTMEQQQQFQLNQHQMQQMGSQDPQDPQQQQQQQQIYMQQNGQFPGYMMGPNGMMTSASFIQRPRLPKIIPSINSMANKFRQHLYQTFKLNSLNGRWPNMIGSASFMSPSYPAKPFPMVSPHGYMMMPSNQQQQQQFGVNGNGINVQQPHATHSQPDNPMSESLQYNFASPGSPGSSSQAQQRPFGAGQFSMAQQSNQHQVIQSGRQHHPGSTVTVSSQNELQMTDSPTMVITDGQPLDDSSALMFAQSGQSSNGDPSSELVVSQNSTSMTGGRPSMEDQIQSAGLELYENQENDFHDSHNYHSHHLPETHLHVSNGTALEFISHPNNSIEASHGGTTTINLSRGKPRQIMTDVSQNLVTSDGTYIQEEHPSNSSSEPIKTETGRKRIQPIQGQSMGAQRAASPPNATHLVRPAHSGHNEPPQGGEANITIHHHHVIATEDQPEEQEKAPSQLDRQQQLGADQQVAQSGVDQNQLGSVEHPDGAQDSDQPKQEAAFPNVYPGRPERVQPGTRQRGENNSSSLSSHYEPERLILKAGSNTTLQAGANRYPAGGVRSKKVLNNGMANQPRNKTRSAGKQVVITRVRHHNNQKAVNQVYQDPVESTGELRDVDYQVIKANPANQIKVEHPTGVSIVHQNETELLGSNEAITINGDASNGESEVGEDQQQQLIGQQVYEPEGQSVMLGEQQVGSAQNEQNQVEQQQVHEVSENGIEGGISVDQYGRQSYHAQHGRPQMDAAANHSMEVSPDYEFRPVDQNAVAEANYSLSGSNAVEPSFEPILISSNGTRLAHKQVSNSHRPANQQRTVAPGQRNNYQQRQPHQTANAASSQHEHYVLVDQPVVLTGGSPKPDESSYQQYLNSSSSVNDQPVVFVSVKPEKVIQPQARKRPLKLPKRSQMRQKSQQEYQLAAQAASNASQLAFGGEQRASEPSAIHSYQNASLTIVTSGANSSSTTSLHNQALSGHRSPDNMRNHNLKATAVPNQAVGSPAARPTKAKIRWQGMSGGQGASKNETGQQRSELASSETSRREQAWIVSGMTHQAYAASSTESPKSSGNGEPQAVGTNSTGSVAAILPLVEVSLQNLTASGNLSQPARVGNNHRPHNHQHSLDPTGSSPSSSSLLGMDHAQSASSESAMAAPPADPRPVSSDSKNGFEAQRVYSHFGLFSKPPKPAESAIAQFQALRAQSRQAAPVNGSTSQLARQRPGSSSGGTIAPSLTLRDSRTGSTSFRLSSSSSSPTSQAPQPLQAPPTPSPEASTPSMEAPAMRRNDVASAAETSEQVGANAQSSSGSSVDQRNPDAASTPASPIALNERPTVFSGLEVVANSSERQLANASSSFSARSDALESLNSSEPNHKQRPSMEQQIDLTHLSAISDSLNENQPEQYRHHETADERLVSSFGRPDQRTATSANSMGRRIKLNQGGLSPEASINQPADVTDMQRHSAD